MQKSHILFEALFGTEAASSDATAFLQQVAEEHPYFTPAQFYLLALQQKNTNGYQQQLSKTALLFNNNYWLNYQLENFTVETQPAVDSQGLIATPLPVETIELTDAAYINQSAAETIATAPVENVNSSDNEHSGTQNITENIAEAEMHSIVSPEEFIPEPVNDADDFILPVATTTAITAEEVAIANDIEIEEPALEEELPYTSNEDTLPGAYTTIEEEVTLTDDGNNMPETAAPAIDIIPPVIPDTQATPQNEKEDNLLLFEPLHTTDYFASVGIKVADEIKPQDKLGQQLLSFTEWLKTMKKIHSQPRLNTTEAAEVAVQHLAEQSNINGDVVTEAMADVLLQQGRADKAIEMLEKLSLLNPAKSAYFASRIQKIKE
jgi:hypothetical protein